MKNQYFGDINDYRKYGLIRALTNHGEIRTSVCWMLTPDDGSSDGGSIEYLRDPGKWRRYDAELFDHLRDAMFHGAERTVRHVENATALPNTGFYSQLLHDSAKGRDQFFAECTSRCADSDVVFFDPDNGMEIRSVPYGRKRSSKYLYWREVEDTWRHGHSLLVYQHFGRQKRDEFIADLAYRFSTHTGAQLVWSFRTSHVVFFLLPQQRHKEFLQRGVTRVSDIWRTQIQVLQHDKAERLGKRRKIMTRVPQPVGESGSLKWIQRLVNQCPELLNAELRRLLRLPDATDIEWVSPIAKDEFAEYVDGEFLERLGLEPSVRPLKQFWPAGGPHWDALAKLPNGGAILVEAKAYVAEMFSNPSSASSDSLRRINDALDETKQFYKAKEGCDWSQKFYQYANRLAHIYFLREVNELDAYLVFVNFVSDREKDGPQSEREWQAAIDTVHEALGVRGRLPGYVADVFVDVEEVAASTGFVG